MSPTHLAQNNKESLSYCCLHRSHPNKPKSSAYSSRISCWLLLDMGDMLQVHVCSAKWQLSLRVPSEGVIRASANNFLFFFFDHAPPPPQRDSSCIIIRTEEHLPLFINLWYPVSSPDSTLLVSSCTGDQKATGSQHQLWMCWFEDFSGKCREKIESYAHNWFSS